MKPRRTITPGASIDSHGRTVLNPGPSPVEVSSDGASLTNHGPGSVYVAGARPMTNESEHALVGMDDGHIAGDEDCPACWHGPFRCSEPGCPGIVHTDYIDESWDRIYLRYQCDVCGTTGDPR